MGFFKRNGCPFAPWKYLFKKELMMKKSIFFEEKVMAEDVDWVVRMTLHAKSIQYQPILLVHYVLLSSSQTATYSLECIKCNMLAANRLCRIASVYI